MSDLIAVKFDENSSTKWLTKTQVIDIVSEQIIKTNQQFQSLTDDEKEIFFANLIKSSSKLNDLTLCMSTRWIYNLLTHWGISERIAKTVSSWLSWFFITTKEIAFTFIKTTVLYIFSHKQILFMLLGINLFTEFAFIPYAKDVVEAYKIYREPGAATDNLRLKMIIDSWKNSIKTNPNAIKDHMLLIDNITGLLYIFWYAQFGFMALLYVKDFINTYKSLKRDCETQHSRVLSPISNKKINKELDKLFKTHSPIISEITNNEPKLHNISNEDYTNHIQQSILLTPLKDIVQPPHTPETQFPDKKTLILNPDDYFNSLYEASIVLHELHEQSRHRTSRTSRKIQRKLNKYFDDSLYKASIRVD